MFGGMDLLFFWHDDMTHFLLATLVTRPLHAGLSLLLRVVAHVMVIANAAGAAVNGIDRRPRASLPLLGAIKSSEAAGADGAGWA